MKISVKPSPSWPKRQPPTEIERLRIRIDKLVAQLDDVPPAMLAKLLMAKALDVLLEAEGSLATISTVGRAADLLGGRWGPSTIKDFLETKNY